MRTEIPIDPAKLPAAPGGRPDGAVRGTPLAPPLSEQTAIAVSLETEDTMKAMHSLARGWYVAPMIAGAMAAAVAPRLHAQDDQLAERAKRAGEVLSELTSAPDSAPPNALLNQAVCVAVVPGVVQAGFGVGGKAGFGLVSCRTGTGWSWPTFIGLKGGSFGFQIAAQSVDVVLIFVNENAPRTVAASSFDIGGEASVTAGPLGRDVAAATDYRAQAEIYSYSKSKGLFAGIKIAGTKWEIDYSANKKAYASAPDSLRGGTHASVAKQLETNGSAAPAIVQPFLQSLQQHVAKASPPTG